MNTGNVTPPHQTMSMFPPAPPSTPRAPAPTSAPKSKTKSAGEKPTGANAVAWFIASNATDINWEGAARAGSYKTGRSAQTAFYVAKKRFLEGLESPINDDDDGAAPATAQPKKRKAAKKADGDDNEKATKRKRVTKKTIKTEEVDDDLEDADNDAY